MVVIVVAEGGPVSDGVVDLAGQLVKHGRQTVMMLCTCACKLLGPAQPATPNFELSRDES
eukprot:6808685-Pyramimonas_sp.AAC.1